MEKQIKFNFVALVNCEVRNSNNWKEGKPILKDFSKKLACMTFKDEEGNFYIYFPLKGEINKIANLLIGVNASNILNISNPEIRPDLEDLKEFLRKNP